MASPPDSVRLVARTHWLVGTAILVSAVFLRWLTSQLPVEFGPRTYAITGGLAALYLLAGTLVWFGAPLGRICSKVAGLIYLARPNFGSQLWRIMDSAEYREHFEKPNR